MAEQPASAPPPSPPAGDDAAASGTGPTRQGAAIYQLFAIFIVLSAVICMAVTVSLLPNLKGLLSAKQKLLEAQTQGLASIPELEKRTAAIDEHLKLITTNSVEARLLAVEKSLHVENVRPEQIASLEDLRKEVDSLKTFMLSDPKAVVELKQLQADYHDLARKEEQNATKDQVKTEITHTNEMLFLLWAVFAVLIAIALAWPRRQRIPTQPVE